MVAFGAYIAGTASLSSGYYAASPLPSGFNATSPLSASNATFCQVSTTTVYQYSGALPTAQSTGLAAQSSGLAAQSSALAAQSTALAQDHGGPYHNPYNDAPMAYTWPGRPTKGEVYPPPQPTTPYAYGGPASASYQAPAWIPKGSNRLDGSMPKGKQNGNSNWGDVNCSHLPLTGLPGGPSYPSSTPSSANPAPYPIVTGSPSFTGDPAKATAWTSYGYGNATASGTQPTASGSFNSTSSGGANCHQMPDTGVTRTYEFDIAYQTIAPDGVPRNGLVINGQFPGPLVEANWGDWIMFKITNDLTDEGTTLHPHGLLQKQTPWYDGVPAVGQCPITPNGGALEMLFRADRYGSSWYHSHYSAQYSGGAHGPMVIYGPKHADYDIDIGPIVVEDWYHADYYTLVNDTMNGKFPPSNNNLINGKMQYPCANTTLPCNPNAGISKFQFQSGKKHLLRIINAGAEGIQKFSIDDHNLTVVSVDYTPVEPYTTNVVTLGIGQRTDVVVEATGEAGDAYWMRSQLATEHCTLNDGISPNAVAAVYYENADTDSVPTSTSDVTAAQLAVCKNDALTLGTPLCKIALDEPTTTEEITFEFKSNGTNFIWFVNNSSYRGDYNQPTLEQAQTGNLNFAPERNVFNFGSNKTVRINLINEGVIGAHPMHLHGHDFHVLAEGFGEWNGTITNPENTVRRDVHILQNAQNLTSGVNPSFMVLQYNQDNPGVWPLHCHLAWHLSGGLFFDVLELPDEIKKQTSPQNIVQGCKAWDVYTAHNIPDQIDSGE